MYVNQYDSNKKCAVNGRNAELQFIQIAKQKNVFLKDLTGDLQEQIHSHSDVQLLINGRVIRVDVKAIKNIKRGQSSNELPIWLEFKNVNGHHGWLFGKSELIAFEMNNHFAIFPRKQLILWCEENIDLSNKTLFASEAYKKSYTRNGRKDIISFIYFEDIAELKHIKWFKDDEQ